MNSKTDLKQQELNLSDQADIIENNKPNEIITEADRARIENLVDDSDEHDHDIGADPQRNRGPSGQGYTGLPIIIESEIIEANHEQPELNLSERNLFQKQRNNRVQPSFGLGNEN